MKQFILSALLVFFCSFFVAQAQTYKLNKEVYNTREYIPQYGDPNNPMIAGLSSFILPGLGQVLCGETARGMAFFGGSMACMGVSVVGMLQNMESNNFFDENNNVVDTKGFGLMLAGVLGYFIVDVWSVFDAVNVAKVNNMYFQDVREEKEIGFLLNPYIGNHNYLGQRTTSVGLSLQVIF